MSLSTHKAAGAQRGGPGLHADHPQGPQSVSGNLRGPEVSQGQSKASEWTLAFGLFILGPEFGVAVLTHPPSTIPGSRGLDLEPLRHRWPGTDFTTQRGVLLLVSDKEGVSEPKACFCPLCGRRVQYLLVNT